MNGPARPVYELRVDGLLSADWSSWFHGLEITTDADHTVLTGPLEDQAALHGVLLIIRDLGLQLISVRRLDVDENPREGDQS